MRIDGMDASSVAYTKVSETSSKDIKPDIKEENKIDTKDTVNLSQQISQMKDYEKKELPVSEKVVIQAIEKANKAISISNRQFEYSIHQKTKEIMVKVVDSETHEVIREIPPEKILDMVAKMWEMAGLVVDERR